MTTCPAHGCDEPVFTWLSGPCCSPSCSRTWRASRIAGLRERLGDGPASLIRPTDPPSMAVEIATDVLPIVPADWTHTRVDLACIRAERGIVHTRVITGWRGWPWVPVPAPGWLPIATIHVQCGADAVLAHDIIEVHP